MPSEIENRRREYAYVLHDEQLIARMSAGDLVAQEAKYHDKCALILFNAARAKANIDYTGS